MSTNKVPKEFQRGAGTLSSRFAYCAIAARPEFVGVPGQGRQAAIVQASMGRVEVSTFIGNSFNSPSGIDRFRWVLAGWRPDPIPVNPRSKDIIEADLYGKIASFLNDPSSIPLRDGLLLGIKTMFEQDVMAKTILGSWVDDLYLVDKFGEIARGDKDFRNFPMQQLLAGHLESVAGKGSRFFVGANLAGVDFSDRSLVSVDFGGAHLDRATFSGAKLTGASFRGADLKNVWFTTANLPHADFTEANLEDASFTGANLSRATLPWVDFTEDRFMHATGLDNVNLLPSSEVG